MDGPDGAAEAGASGAETGAETTAAASGAGAGLESEISGMGAASPVPPVALVSIALPPASIGAAAS